MNEIFENLWICPVCSAEHPHPVITCIRCDCQLLLLNKVKILSWRLKEAGYEKMAKRFYDFEKEL